MKFFLYIILIFSVMACSRVDNRTVEKEYVTKTVYVEKPKPIVPNLNPLQLSDVEWDILTAGNQNEKFSKSKVYYGLSTSEYEKLILNLNSLRGYIESQKEIINKYNK